MSKTPEQMLHEAYLAVFKDAISKEVEQAVDASNKEALATLGYIKGVCEGLSYKIDLLERQQAVLEGRLKVKPFGE